MREDQQRQAPAILMIAYTNYETDPRVIRAAEAAAEAGFAVDVVCLRRGEQSLQEIVNGVRILRVAQTRYRGRSRLAYGLSYLAFALRCFALSTTLFVKCRYRVVHVHNMPDVLVFSALVPKLFGAKVILDIHDPMPETFSAKYAGQRARLLHQLLLWLERLSVAFSDRIVTVNHPVRDGVLAAHGYSPADIDVVPNFADDRLFTCSTYPPITDRIRFVFHGTILERYGLRTLVEAVAQVRNRHRIHVTIIGDGDYGEALKGLIRDRKVGDVIEFDNRMYPLHRIPARLADFHAGIVPLDVTPVSTFALPLKLLEYTCMGLPSITVDTPAITYYFGPDECLFYPPGDAASLAALFDAVAERPTQLAECRDKLAAVRQRMSWTREKKQYVRLLRRLTAASTPDLSRNPADDSSR